MHKNKNVANFSHNLKNKKWRVKNMLHKTHVRRAWYAACLALFAGAWAVAVSTVTAFADGPVVQGTVKTTGGTAIPNARVELHTPDGNFSVNANTDTSGTYTFAQALTPGTSYVVESTAITGYNSNEPHQQNFVYQSGDAVRNYDFTFTNAAKTISGTVTDTAGNKITDADVQFTPYEIIGASSSNGRTDQNGAYSVTVVGGAWFAQAAVNLSEYTPRWIAEQAPIRVNFATNETAESKTVNFVVTPATGKVTAKLLNSDGAKLTTSDFVADIDFRRADGVGTARKVQQADSSLSVYLTPGIYNICAFHRDLDGKSFNPAQTSFVMTDGGTIDLGTIQAEVNTAHLTGKVVDGAGKGIGGVALMATREGGCNRPTTTTQPDGSYDMTVGAGAWSVGLNSADPQYSQTAPVSAIVTNGQTVTGLNFTLKVIDKTITGNVLGAAGTKLTDYVGSAYVQSSSKGTKVYAPVVDGAFTIKYSSFDIPGSAIFVGAEATEGSSYTGSTKAKATITGASATKDVTVLTYDASVSGTLLLPSGAAAANTNSAITVEGVDENGNYISTDVSAAGAYNLPLAKGTWMFDYNIEKPEATDGLMNRPAGQNSVTVSSGQAVTKNLTVRQGTNTITGTVTNMSGAAVARALVNIDNRPKLEDSANSKPEDIVSVTVETNDSGVYTTKVPNGTFLITVGDTPAVGETEIMPDAKSVKVSGGSTTTANLKFEKSNATIVGKVSLSNKADGGGIVNAWTQDGASVSATVKKDGTYTLNVTSGELWHVGVDDLKGSKLLESPQVDITTKVGKNTVNLAMADTGIVVPGPVTKSCAADETCTVSLPNGTSVTLPPFAVDLTGTIKITLSPSIDLDKSVTDVPATLAYDVKALNNAGNAVSELNEAAEVTIPYSQSEAASNGLNEKRLTPTYFNPNTNTWEDSGSTGVVDTKNNIATIKTEHFTKFSVTGTAKAAASISGFKFKSGNKTSMVIEVTGKNLSAAPSVVFGGVKASKVVVKKDTITITVPTKGLKAGKQTLVLTTSNGRLVELEKTVTIKAGVPKI